MMIFRYGGKYPFLLRALVFVVLGVLMIVAKADAMQIVVKVIAAFMLATGLVSVWVGMKHKQDGTMPLSFFNAATNVVIAVLLFRYSDFVAGFVSYLIGVVLFGFGLFQSFALLSLRGKVKLGLLSYLVPLFVAAIGALIFLSPAFLGQSIGLIAGLALVIYGISVLVSAIKMRAVMEEPEDVAPAPKDSESLYGTGSSVPEDAKEVDYEKVDEQ